MKHYNNIERINGHLVGYGPDGVSWRITGRHGNWTARRTYGNGLLVGFENLSEISNELTNWINP